MVIKPYERDGCLIKQTDNITQFPRFVELLQLIL